MEIQMIDYDLVSEDMIFKIEFEVKRLVLKENI